MVEIKGVTLNHLYQIECPMAEVAIASTGSSITSAIELFERSLALASDLKRLPLLESWSCNWRTLPWLAAEMQAGGINEMTVTVRLYNGAVEAENQIATYSYFIQQTAGKIDFIVQDDCDYPFGGEILLSEKINIVLACVTNGAVAASPIIAGSMQFDATFEIDWREISKSILQDYIMEHLYAKD